MIRASIVKIFLAATVLTTVLLLTACQSEVSPSVVFTPTPHGQTTGTADPSTGITDQASPTRTQAELTASILNQPCNIMEEVLLPQGGTSFLTSGVITPTEKHCFALEAGANQLLTVAASSAEDNVQIDVFGWNGITTVLSQSPPTSRWVGLLPATQEYLVVLTTTGSTTDYFLSIEIPANLVLEPPQTSLEIDSRITVNQTFHPDIFTRVRYRLYVPTGRTLSVNLTSPDPTDLSLGIYGEIDGQPYKRFEILGNVFSLEIPVSQNYFIDIYGISGNDSPFTLQLNLTD